MKHERSLQEQTRRIDNQKANKPIVVTELPPRGEEGDVIHLGEPPDITDTTKQGYYMRLQGQWRFIGAAAIEDDDGTDDDGTGEETLAYSTELE